MGERTGGVRSILSSPRVYRLSQRLAGSARSHRRFLEDHVKPREGERILDLGCGPAEILQLMPDVRYVGYDLNPAYIEEARRRYGDRGEFHAAAVEDVELPADSFDVVMAIALVHHLDDDSARAFFALA